MGKKADKAQKHSHGEKSDSELAREAREDPRYGTGRPLEEVIRESRGWPSPKKQRKLHVTTVKRVVPNPQPKEDLGEDVARWLGEGGK
jgi:hypothetical protein